VKGPFLYPHLAVLDGYEAMEGEGPSNGSAAAHRPLKGARERGLLERQRS